MGKLLTALLFLVFSACPAEAYEGTSSEKIFCVSSGLHKKELKEKYEREREYFRRGRQVYKKRIPTDGSRLGHFNQVDRRPLQ